MTATRLRTPRLNMFLAAGTLVGLLLTAGCGLGRTASATPDPRQIALRPGDITGDFAQLTHRYWTDHQLAQRTGTLQKQYAQHALVRAYETSYLRLTHVGLARIGDIVYQFGDENGARWFVDRLRQDAAVRRYLPFRFNVPLGDQLYAYTFHPTFNGLEGTEYVVYYRRAATVVSFIAAGQAGPFMESAEMVPFVGSVDLRARSAYRA